VAVVEGVGGLGDEVAAGVAATEAVLVVEEGVETEGSIAVPVGVANGRGVKVQGAAGV
jgi:hypothetical protein